MCVFWPGRSSATSSRQSPHPRTSSGSGVIGPGLLSRPHSGESPGAWWTTAAATLLSSRLRSPSAMVKGTTPSEAKSHSLLPQTSGSVEPCHCSPLPVSPAAITRRPQTPQLMAWSFPQAPSWLVTTIVVLRHWGRRLPGRGAWRSSPLNKRPFLRGPVRTYSVSFGEPINKSPQQ